MDSNSDSDFYGNDQEVQNLRDRAQDFNSTKWWTRHGLNGGTQSHATTTSIMKKDDRLSSPIHKIKLEETEAEAKPLNTFSPSCTESSSNNKAAGADAEEDSPEDGNSRSDSDSNNPYAGVPFAWQYNETLSSFLARLPPSTTPQTKETPWIYVCNPCWKHSDTTTVTIKHEERPFSSSPPAKPPLGCENEGPLPHTALEGGGLRHFIHGGKQRLGILAQFAEDLRTEKRMTTARKEKELVDERKLCAEDILTLAHFSHVRVGKWMLFIQPNEVDSVWRTIATATANGQLGIAAKVSPNSTRDEMNNEHAIPRGKNNDAAVTRLICVYTYDFSDKADVRRVLNKLRELDVFSNRGSHQNIYYKTDAFTYLGIARGNHWKLRPVLYGSWEFPPPRSSQASHTMAAGWRQKPRPPSKGDEWGFR